MGHGRCVPSPALGASTALESWPLPPEHPQPRRPWLAPTGKREQEPGSAEQHQASSRLHGAGTAAAIAGPFIPALCPQWDRRGLSSRGWGAPRPTQATACMTCSCRGRTCVCVDTGQVQPWINTGLSSFSLSLPGDLTMGPCLGAGKAQNQWKPCLGKGRKHHTGPLEPWASSASRTLAGTLTTGCCDYGNCRRPSASVAGRPEYSSSASLLHSWP